MKKFSKLFICLVFVALFALVGCKKDPIPAEKASYKLGMGVVVSLESSKTGTAQVDATVAAVVTDKDGKIVACRIDVAQSKASVADGAFEAKVLESKMELKERYNMAAYGKPNVEGGTVKEWYIQAKAFEAYVEGKTASEVAAIELQEVNNHMIAKDEALLSAGCTMQITDFQAAIAKACADEQGQSFEVAADAKLTLGVACVSTADASCANATADADGKANIYTDFACAVVVDGKIFATLNDAIQPKITFNVAGEITGKSFSATKRELKEKYNMAAYGKPNVEGGTVKEWYIQSAAFSKHVLGMTGAEVAAMTTKEVNDHLISTDEALLSAGCTMQITGICKVVSTAVSYAR